MPVNKNAADLMMLAALALAVLGVFGSMLYAVWASKAPPATETPAPETPTETPTPEEPTGTPTPEEPEVTPTPTEEEPTPTPEPGGELPTPTPIGEETPSTPPVIVTPLGYCEYGANVASNGWQLQPDVDNENDVPVHVEPDETSPIYTEKILVRRMAGLDVTCMYTPAAGERWVYLDAPVYGWVQIIDDGIVIVTIE